MRDQDQPFVSLDLWIDHNAGALICCHDKCRCAISVKGSRPTTHLRSWHGISTEHRKGLTQRLAAFKLRNPEDIRAFEDGSPQHTQLRTYKGFACKQCKLRTTSLQTITQRHYLKGPEGYSCSSASASQKFAVQIDDFVEPVRLQTWNTGPGRKYWIVADHSNAAYSAENQQGNAKENDHYQLVRQRENERNRIRDLRAAETRIDNSVTSALSLAEQRPCLERTGWEKTLDLSLHQEGSTHKHVAPPTLTDKTDAADLPSFSSKRPVRTFYATNDLDDSGTHFYASPTSEAISFGAHPPLVSSNTTQDPNKHEYLIHGRNLAALHNKQQEMSSFNAFLHKYLIQRQSNSLMHERLSRMIKTTRWWGLIGCPLCFLCDGTETEHTLHRCKRDELRNKTLSIIKWLEDLRIPQHASEGGSCSICLSFYACGEAADTTGGSDFGTYCNRDSINDQYSGSRCEIKPIICMALASLAAYDGQIFANMLAKVPLATDAKVWFERRIPYDGRWFSNLLLAYEEVMLAFYYSRNMRRGKGPLWRFPSYPPAPEPPAYQAIGKACPKWDTAEEVTSWEAAIGRWDGKCPLCTGRGMGGKDIQHTLRQCTRGGSQTLRSELAEAMYEEGIVPKNGCDTCHIPYDFCDDWAGMEDGEWVTITTAKGVLCQFEPHLLWDTIIGLYHCGQREIVDELHTVARDYCVQRGMTVAHDQKTIALALSQPITVTGVAGSQLLRTLVVLTSLVLYKVKRDKEDENSVHLL